MGSKGAAPSGSSSKKAANSVNRSSASLTRLQSSLTKNNITDDVAEGHEHTNDEDEEEEVDDDDDGDNDGDDNTALQEEVTAEGDIDVPDETNVEDAGEENDAEDGGEENDADDGGEENDGDDDDEEEDDREARQPKKRRRRQWELWSSQDKDIFFEAINECGKNFDSIQAFFQSRNQKKGLPASQGKNKDQVRHFYYRTWHKISKYISFAGNAKKSTQEIYGLVNYGEFRRRVGGTLDYKRGLKLRELVLQGTTSVRLKGRSIRIRTPQCRALKKFNQPQDESRGSEPLPRRISVLLSAGSSSAWTHVHGLAHNPRLRTALSPNRSLRDLLVFLQHKWRLKQLKTCASILKKSTRSVPVPEVEEPLLRLRPPPQSTVTLSRITQVTAEQPLCASLLSHESWLQKSGYPKTAKSKARRKEPKKLEEPRSKGAENAGASTVAGAAAAVDETWDASQEETDYSDVEELGLRKTTKRSAANACPDSQTSDEEHEIPQARQSEPTASSRPRVHFKGNKSKGGLSLELCTVGISSTGGASAEATCLSSSNCDNLPKKRSLADARTGGATDSDSVVATPKSKKRKSQRIKFANACEDSHDEAINDYYDERDTECDDEEVDDDDDNEEREGEKDEETKVKSEVPESKDGVASSESVMPAQPLSVRVATIRAGWTLASVGRLTVGELFVMLGRKNPLLLEYEFESFKKELPASDAEKNSTLCSTQPVKETPKTEVTDMPNLKINVKLGASLNVASATPVTHGTFSTATSTADLSGMLGQLLELSQQLFHKNSLLDGTTKLCPCRLSKGLKSPLGGGSSRSPRMSVMSARSPDACAAAPPAEKSKPSSAKRLIAPDDADAQAAGGSSKRHCTRASDTSSTTADTRTDVTSTVTTSRPAVLLSSQAKLEAEISALPRYCQRYKNRQLARKNVVVQRQLPLLPKQPPAPPVLLPAWPRPLQPKPSLLNLNNCNIGTNKNLYVALPGAPNISLKIGCPTLIAPVSSTTLPTAPTQPVQTANSNVRMRSVIPTPASTVPPVTSAASRSNTIPTTCTASDSNSSKSNSRIASSSPMTIRLPTVSLSESVKQGPRNSFPSLRWSASDHPNIIVGAPLEGLTSQEVSNVPIASKPTREMRHRAVKCAPLPLLSTDLPSYNEKSLQKPETGNSNDCSLSDILNMNTTNDSLSSSFLESLCCSAVREGITLHSSDMEGVASQTVIDSAGLPATSIGLTVSLSTPAGQNAGGFTLSTPQGDFSSSSQNFGEIMGDLNTPKHESEAYNSTKAPSPESNTLDANISFGVPCKDKINIVISDPIRSVNTAFGENTSSLFSSPRVENTNAMLGKDNVALPVSSVATKVMPSVTSSEANTMLHPSLTSHAPANNLQLPAPASVDMLGISLDLSNSSTGFSNLLSSVVGAACPAPESESSLLNTPPRPKGAPPPPTARPSTPSSPSRFVPRDDWMAGSVGDFSLTGLFDSIDPLKDAPVPPEPPQGGGVGPHHQVPPSAALLSVLNENGVDFTAKFDALASSRSADPSH